MAATLTRITKDMKIVEYFQLDSGIAELDGAGNGEYSDLLRKEAGLWFGKGADMLGLNGAVGSVELDALQSGRIPDAGTRVEDWAEIDRAGMKGGTNDLGVDLTLSPPKSVSIEALVFGSREAIEAHEAAVASTLEFIERNFIEYRANRRKNGKRYMVYIPTGNMVAATFQHETSRSLDPHLHTHCIIANITHRENRGWTPFYPGGLTSNMRVVRGYYHNELARNLMKCGYGIRRVVHTISSAFEIEGYGPEILGAFSARKTAISDSIRQTGLKRTRHSMNRASRFTRDKKKGVSRQALRDSWRMRREGLGFDRPVSGPEGRDEPRPEHPPTTATDIELRQSIDAALDFYGSHTPVVSEIEIQAGVLGLLPGRADIDRINGMIAGMVAEGRLIQAMKYRYRLSWITSEERDAEHRLAERAKHGQGQVTPINPTPGASKDGGMDGLSTGQKEALAMTLTSRDHVTGMFGHTGSSMASPIRKTVELSGDREYIGLAPTIGGAMLLEAETGIPTGSLQEFLAEYRNGGVSGVPEGPEVEQKPAGTVLVLDQAMYMNNRQMVELLDASRRQGIERVVAVASNALLRGHDSRQPFMNLVESGMPAVEVMDTERMEHRKLAVPVGNVLDGALMRSMDSLAEAGESTARILVEADRDDMPRIAAALHLESAREPAVETRVAARSDNLRCEIDQEIRSGAAESREPAVQDDAGGPEPRPDLDDPQDSGGLVELSLDLDALKHMDHGSSGTASSARMSSRVIAVFESGEGDLAEQQNLAAGLARDSDEAIVLTDDIEAFTKDFEKNTGIRLSETRMPGTPDPDPWPGGAAAIGASLPPEIATVLRHAPEAVANAPERSDFMLPAPAIPNGDGSGIIETGRDGLVQATTELWLGLDHRTRERTAIWAPPDLQSEIGREIRNHGRREGWITGPEAPVGRVVEVPMALDAGERAAHLQPDDLLVFPSAIPAAGIEAGDTMTVLEPGDGGGRGLLVSRDRPGDGSRAGFLDPACLADGRAYRTMPMPLASNDRIRWRRDDPDLGVVAGRLARVVGIEGGNIHLLDRAGGRTALLAGHPVFTHSDYAFNLSAWESDNGRVDNVVAVVDTARPQTTQLLAAGREVGRRRGNALLVTDDPARLNRLIVKAGGTPLEPQGARKAAARSIRG